MPPILGLIFEQILQRGGPAAVQLYQLALQHGNAEDVAELNRQIATDENLKATFQREIDRMTALLAGPPVGGPERAA